MARKRVKKNIAYDDVRKTYYVYLHWGKDENGKSKDTSETTKNLKEAEKILKKHQKEMAAGTAVMPVKNTLVDAVEAYIRYKELDLAKTTINGYRNILKNHIQPYFKDMQIQKVSVQVLQDFRVHETNRGLDNNSISKYSALLHSVFKDACNKDIVGKNPVEKMDRISSKKKEHEFMNTQEIAELCSSVAGTKLELPVTLAVYLGLRRGEVLGLRWQDVDFNTGVLRVDNTRTKAGGDVIVKEPKTEKSRRAFIMPRVVREVLLKAKHEQQEIKAKHKRYNDSGYVVTRHDGTPFSPNYLSDLFHEHIKKMRMKPITFHGLRHAFASIANDSGVAMGEISATMGHSNIGVTASIYTHDFAEKKAVAVNAVAGAIDAAKTVREAC